MDAGKPEEKKKLRNHIFSVRLSTLDVSFNHVSFNHVSSFAVEIRGIFALHTHGFLSSLNKKTAASPISPGVSNSGLTNYWDARHSISPSNCWSPCFGILLSSVF